ncbi:MAG: antibiotic biosynthesis monooxygenase [Verrucomicrobiales bacterium]|nr:antibiotic biosynthesis monooxygenase [Verrucomicrobiales bacterium]|tara:strand:- start:3310 stop:3720 length:411 start_codon:yes stop_codon:yes gene_type:complete
MNPKDKPFILIARVRVMPGKVEDYLKIAELVDAEVEKTEPGMLFHNFDADPTDPLKFTWTELYKDDASLINHLNNPPVQDYVAKHLELAESLEVEIYGTLNNKTVEYLKTAWGDAGIPFKYFKSTRVGYIRDSISE